MKRFSWSTSLLALTMMAGTCLAQTPDAAKFYRLDFVVKELDGAKTMNARAYSMIVSTDKTSPPSSIRAGSKVPSPVSPGSSQVNFIELGVNIDCRSVQEVSNQLSMIVTVDISSTQREGGATPPVIRQNKWTSTITIPFRKATVVFSSDDATSRGQQQLEITATPIK